MNMKLVFCLVSVATAHLSYAQTVPSDLLDLSLEELFSIDVEPSDTSNTKTRPRWGLSYSYQRSNFNDYYDGKSKVSTEDVLWRPGQEQRTSKNYPVVPIDIQQEVHALQFRYRVTDSLSLSIVTPYIKQDTDHISIVPGYNRFVIASDGLGDVTFMGTHIANPSLSSNWQTGIGVSIPTGSIDEQGDTPRAPGKQQLPYTMQLGSGTYDIPAFVAYVEKKSTYDWGLRLAGKLRLGENDRNYTLGNNISFTSWARLTTLDYFQPFAQLAYRYGGRISGKDEDLEIPGPYPYPAPVVDPARFGGQQADVKIGVRVPIINSAQYIELTYSLPVYQKLNGPQSGEDYSIGVSFNASW